MASALESKLIKNEDFATYENRKRVVQHIMRERSLKLALIAKVRDGFTCRICDFNFVETYGELGRGYAEAHHVVALSSLRKEIQTRVKDLITVCPNCHRVLYRMDGHLSDVVRLRRLIRRTN
ncbi:MAG: HNH endonuclease [Bacteroidota bacterium]